MTEVEMAAFSAVSSIFSLSYCKMAGLTDSTVAIYISVTVCKNETVGVFGYLGPVLFSKSGQVGEKHVEVDIYLSFPGL